MRSRFRPALFLKSAQERLRPSLALLGAVLLLILWSCQLGSGTKVEETASFGQLYDSLSKYDSVIIVFNDAKGRFLDTVYQGKVNSHAKLVNLPVNGWDGGKAIISITGITDGKVVYEVEKNFDGTVNQVDDNTYVILPGTAISGNFQEWPMTVGDSLKLPVITVTPDALSDKSIRWIASDTAILQLGSGFVRAKSPGTTNLTASLQSDSTKIFVIVVTVNSNTRLPDFAVLIQAPPDKSFANKSPIKIAWTVNSKTQDSLTLEYLKDGANTVTRAFRDSLNRVFSASITVYFDTVAPNKPIVHGDSLTAATQPTWTWATGGDGSGSFRVSVDSESFSGGEIRDTSYSPTSALSVGAHTFYVQERDSAGNWSTSGKFTTTIDLTMPTAPTVHVTPVGPTNQVKPVWTWSSAGGSGQFQFLLDKNDFSGSTTSTPDTTFTPTTGLTDGPHALYVRERGKAGTWSTAGSATVNIDLSVPNAPNIVSPTTPTRTTKPTWTWSGNGGGNGTYQYQLDDNPAVTTTALTFTPGTTLSDGTHSFKVQEKNNAGTWSAVASSFVLIKSAPLAPTVSVAAALTNAPSWAWTPAANSGGNGSYVYQLDGGAASEVQSVTQYTPVLSEGSHTLCVSEQDALGFGSQGCKSLQVDLTPPALTIIAPVGMAKVFSNSPNATGTAIDANGIKSIFYVLNSGATQSIAFSGSPWNLNSIPWVEDRNIIAVTVIDNANNSTTIRDTVYKKSNVIFVRKGAAGDGTSWANAYGELNIPLSNSAKARKVIWVSGGTYSPTVAQLSSGSGMEVPANDSIYGAFPSNGTGISLSIRDVNLNPTIIQNPNLDGALVTFAGDSTILNGFILEKASAGIASSGGVNNKIVNCTFRNFTWMNNNPVVMNSDGSSLIDSCLFTGNQNTYQGVLRGGGYTISHTTIQNNTSNAWSGGISESGDVTMHDMIFSNNHYDDGTGTLVSAHVLVATGTLTYQKSTCTLDGLADGSGIIAAGGTIVSY